MDEQRIQRENANDARVTCRQQEVDAAAAAAGQPASNIAQGVGDQPALNVVNGAQLPTALAAPE
jgi:hypothetical protein